MKLVFTKQLLQVSIVSFFLLTASTTFSQTNLNTGLVAYYPFSGNALDSSGNNNNPSYNNATLVADRFGNPNSAFSFDGYSSYIQIPGSTSLNTGPSVSLSVWVKPNGFYMGTCNGNYILSKGLETQTGYNAVYSDAAYDNTIGRNQCNYPTDTSHEFFYGMNCTSTPNLYIHTGSWYHLVYTNDGSVSKFYVNDSLISINSGTIIFNNNDLYLGRYFSIGSTPYWLNGVLDDIRIYNRALDSSEVTTLYYQPNPHVATPPIIVDSAKCDAQLVISGSPNNKLFQTSAFLNNPNAGPNGDTSGTELYAFAWTANNINIPNYNGRSLIKYDIRQIPIGAVVKSAKLYLYAKLQNINGILHSPTYGVKNTALLQKVNTPWTLPQVNYYTNLDVDTAKEVILAESTIPAQNYVADLTDYAQSWVNDPTSNNGLLFRMQTENDPYNSMIFESGLAADTNKRPRLEICYSLPPTLDTTHQTITLYGDSSNTGFKGVVIVKDSLLGLNIDTTGGQICAYSWGKDSITITYKNGWSIIQYDVSQIPPTAVIDSAAIYFYAKLNNLDCATGSPTIGPNNEGILNRILDYWETGNNQHAPVVTIDSLTPVDLPASISPTEDYKANITSFVKAWVKNPSSNHGMTLRLKKPDTGNNSLIFESSKSSNKAKRPKLAISYTLPKPLPIVLRSFTASVLTGSYTSIDFATTNEADAIAINIEKSYNGINFELATTLRLKGNSGLTNYSYTDKIETNALKVYYRLKAMNKDGSYRFSNIITLPLSNNLKRMSVGVYPNPIRSAPLQVNLNLLRDEAVTFRVYAMNGKLVLEQKIQGAKGQSLIRIDAFRTIKAGIYTLNITSNSDAINEKIIKIND